MYFHGLIKQNQVNKTPSMFVRRGGSEWMEHSRMAAKKDKSLNLSSVVDKITNYISSYASSTASWITYPYYGISTGVVSMIVLFVVIYILIVGQSIRILSHILCAYNAMFASFSYMYELPSSEWICGDYNGQELGRSYGRGSGRAGSTYWRHHNSLQSNDG